MLFEQQHEGVKKLLRSILEHCAMEIKLNKEYN